MRLTRLLGSAALALAPSTATVAAAQDAETLPPCENCSDDLVIMSWGGAYQEMQLDGLRAALHRRDRRHRHLGRELRRGGGQAARHGRGRQRHRPTSWTRGRRRDPRSATRASAMEIDFDDVAGARRPTAPRPTDDFGDNARQRLLRADRSSSRPPSATAPTWPSGTAPCPTTSATSSTSRPSRASARSRARPKKNLEWALICDGVAKADLYDVLDDRRGRGPGAGQARHHQGPASIWWSAGAETPQLLADKEVVMGSTYNGRLFSVIEEQNQPVAMLWDYAGARLRRLRGARGPARGPAEPRQALPLLRHRHPAARPTRRPTSPTARRAPPRGRWWASTPRSASTWRRTCRPRPRTSTNSILFNYDWWADHRDEHGRPLPGLAVAVRRGRRGPRAPPARARRRRRRGAAPLARESRRGRRQPQPQGALRRGPAAAHPDRRTSSRAACSTRPSSPPPTTCRGPPCARCCASSPARATWSCARTGRRRSRPCRTSRCATSSWPRR